MFNAVYTVFSLQQLDFWSLFSTCSFNFDQEMGYPNPSMGTELVQLYPYSANRGICFKPAATKVTFWTLWDVLWAISPTPPEVRDVDGVCTLLLRLWSWKTELDEIGKQELSLIVGPMLIHGDKWLPTDLRVTPNVSLLYRIISSEFQHTVDVGYAYIRNTGLECYFFSHI